ncbi:MAG: EscU/YscU/HrcU family type III secretion system export apparatus switch protein [Verrucomicrobia bacterium]|nr:EscU/YscU/HrcU family type III secretion system export apparatus switch protein [Verrucomicrobiota bacterium]
MSEFSEKTEQPSPHKLEEAQKRGQIPRSAEVQTTFVLLGGLVGLLFFGSDTWRLLTNALTATLNHLHDTQVSVASLQAQALEGALLALRCAGPVTAGALVGGLLAGGLQSRFQTASEALQPNWERLNPAQGFQRVFSMRSAVPTVIAAVKVAVIILLTYSTVQQVLSDPVFSSTVSLERLAAFLASASVKIFTRVLLALAVIAAADYAYQLWRTHQDLMMTRDELKEETKNQEGNPQVKANRRRLFRRPPPSPPRRGPHRRPRPHQPHSRRRRPSLRPPHHEGPAHRRQKASASMPSASARSPASTTSPSAKPHPSPASSTSTAAWVARFLLSSISQSRKCSPGCTRPTLTATTPRPTGSSPRRRR